MTRVVQLFTQSSQPGPEKQHSYKKKECISVSFQRGGVTCDESCAIIYTVHLRLIYEAKIQVLSVFS